MFFRWLAVQGPWTTPRDSHHKGTRSHDEGQGQHAKGIAHTSHTPHITLVDYPDDFHITLTCVSYDFAWFSYGFYMIFIWFWILFHMIFARLPYESDMPKTYHTHHTHHTPHHPNCIIFFILRNKIGRGKFQPHFFFTVLFACLHSSLFFLFVFVVLSCCAMSIAPSTWAYWSSCVHLYRKQTIILEGGQRAVADFDVVINTCVSNVS